MIVVGTEKRLVHIEVSDNQIADIIQRSSDQAFKVGVREKIERTLLERFNVDRTYDEKAEFICKDAVGILCYAKEQEHYHGSSTLKFFQPLSKKELDILENMFKMLSVFD